MLKPTIIAEEDIFGTEKKWKKLKTRKESCNKLCWKVRREICKEKGEIERIVNLAIHWFDHILNTLYNKYVNNKHSISSSKSSLKTLKDIVNFCCCNWKLGNFDILNFKNWTFFVWIFSVSVINNQPLIHPVVSKKIWNTFGKGWKS